VSVTQGDQSWNISVNPRSNEIITYTVRYAEEGNFSLPKPYASFGFQGLQAHTIGRGANVTVKLILGPGMEEEVKEAVVEPVEEIEKEKEEMSFLEYDEQVRKKQLQVITKYGLMGIIVVIVMVLIIAYIEYQRRKAPTAPFMGEGGTPPDEEEKS